jgi:uncharacterized protein YndB with AHSA1/START domain
MIDILTEINAIHREVMRTGAEGEIVTVLLRRSYPANIEDVWDAITDPDRMKRWFMPVTGDLREGGTFQLEGNAGGQIRNCDRPRRLKVTFGGETSLVEVRLAADGNDHTTLELEHSVPLEMAGSGAGSLYVGPGWDGALLGLGQFLRAEVTDDPVAAANSLETQEFSKESIHAWSATVEASGTATSEEIAAAVKASEAQFSPDLSG